MPKSITASSNQSLAQLFTLNMPIKQILFDCDNTLVLSEELAFEATADLVNAILTKHGVDAKYTNESLIEHFVGQKFSGILPKLMQIHNVNLPASEIIAYVKSEQEMVNFKLEANAKSCIGTDEILEMLHEEKKYNLAVVSSSALPRIRTCLDRVGLSKFIPYDAVFSAASSLPKPKYKPDPAVYLFAIEKLGVKAEECVAVEDSRSGAAAACRANIRTVAYVGSYNGEKKRKEIGDLLVKTGCCKVMSDWSEFAAILAEIKTEISIQGASQDLSE